MNKNLISHTPPLLLLSLFASGSLFAQDDSIQEITVIGRQEFIQKEFTANRAGSTVDAAKLINQVPEGSVGTICALLFQTILGQAPTQRVDSILTKENFTVVHEAGNSPMTNCFQSILISLDFT